MEPAMGDEEVKDTGGSKIFSRELYAQRDFWNDRFAETNGHFDWYANWKQIKPIFHVRNLNTLKPLLTKFPRF